jgi:chlorophyllide a hydrolase
VDWRTLNPFNEDFGSMAPIQVGRAEQLIVAYWLISSVLGLLFLRDWIFAWNVPATLQTPWLLALLLGTLILSQVLYIKVSTHGGRRIPWLATLIFAICNGIAETFSFALVFRLGLVIGSFLSGLLAPSLAAYGGLALGLVFFVIYGGAIHGLFWIRLLPPHFHDDPLSLKIRRLRPLSETLLVIGWSLAWWLNADLWSVVVCHTLIDLTLMLQVRPPLFQRGARLAAPSASPAPALAPLAEHMPARPQRIYGLPVVARDEALQSWGTATGLVVVGVLSLLRLALPRESVEPRVDAES